MLSMSKNLQNELFSSRGTWNLVRIHDIMDFMKYWILNEKLAVSATKMQLGCGWIFQQDTDSEHTSETTEIF